MEIKLNNLTKAQLDAMERVVGNTNRLKTLHGKVTKAINEIETTSRDLYIDVLDSRGVLMDKQAKSDLRDFLTNYKDRLAKEISEIEVVL